MLDGKTTGGGRFPARDWSSPSTLKNRTTISEERKPSSRVPQPPPPPPDEVPWKRSTRIICLGVRTAGALGLAGAPRSARGPLAGVEGWIWDWPGLGPGLPASCSEAGSVHYPPPPSSLAKHLQLPAGPASGGQSSGG